MLRPTIQFLPCSRAWRIWEGFFGYDIWCLRRSTLDSASGFFFLLSVMTASDTKTFTLSNLVEGGIGVFFFELLLI
jgi:hypothetical protein